MVVDAVGAFVTQRTESRLARIAATPQGRSVALDCDGHPSLIVEPPPAEAPRRRVRIWDDEVDAVDGGSAASAWLAAVLGSPLSLVYMPPATERAVSAKYGDAGDIVSFADAFPVLVTTTASLADLDARMPAALPMDRFRPSIVVDGTEPWDEDAWSRIRIGATTFRLVKGCDRCVVTTTDQLTGERGKEPLRTLATFRERDRKVYFGVNGIPDDEGEIAVGDAVTVLDRRAVV